MTIEERDYAPYTFGACKMTEDGKLECTIASGEEDPTTIRMDPEDSLHIGIRGETEVEATGATGKRGTTFHINQTQSEREYPVVCWAKNRRTGGPAKGEGGPMRKQMRETDDIEDIAYECGYDMHAEELSSVIENLAMNQDIDEDLIDFLVDNKVYIVLDPNMDSHMAAACYKSEQRPMNISMNVIFIDGESWEDLVAEGKFDLTMTHEIAHCQEQIRTDVPIEQRRAETRMEKQGIIEEGPESRAEKHLERKWKSAERQGTGNEEPGIKHLYKMAEYEDK